MTDKVQILGVPIDNVDYKEAINISKNFIENGMNKTVVTPNSEIILYADKDPEFKEIIKDADLVVPDGAGVILASKILNNSLKERVAGVDLVKSLLELGNQREYRFYFLGGSKEVAKKVEVKLINDYPGISIKTHHGYFDEKEEKKIIDELKEQEYDVLLVGMGSPRQERWLAKNQDKLNFSLGIGVGGSFDVLVGEKKRAPVIMQKLYLEWLYRLIQEPKRIWRIRALPIFIMKVIKEKLNG
ncbi:WecB/TagA/CpsF family glycosyltransferase [Natranaerofaba carboxydovora]|uniref:WecB/TagA/CpsF family glycosyltransferase n=1 Tax=Natranaerofaba carboxydovora TaxID=2742683 RepID=UPI001F13C6FD|nr:WecB/TagA/CpsF family glycosyltransferase [Natranaerofaba carboxydovora]UMZ75085.1 N-acetylglucosaminyldiphosphoundecaprenol N-acetyl-beta-D-mannosaminyltransferase [Natranaerofaba carboxydovora]